MLMPLVSAGKYLQNEVKSTINMYNNNAIKIDANKINTAKKNETTHT